MANKALRRAANRLRRIKSVKFIKDGYTNDVNGMFDAKANRIEIYVPKHKKTSPETLAHAVEHEQGHYAYRQLRKKQRAFGDSNPSPVLTHQDRRFIKKAKDAKREGLFDESANKKRYAEEVQAWRYAIAGGKLPVFNKKLVKGMLGSYASKFRVPTKELDRHVDLLSRYHRMWATRHKKYGKSGRRSTR